MPCYFFNGGGRFEQFDKESQKNLREIRAYTRWRGVL